MDLEKNIKNTMKNAARVSYAYDER